MTGLVRGWCPDLFAPMEAGDGWLMRIKPFAGGFGAEAARQVADAARRHGNGAIEVTNRGNLQLRGFSAASAHRFAADAVALGLGCADPAAERRRNLMVSPLAGCDPDCDAATLDLARDLERVVVADAALGGLPGKFGFMVDGGGALPLGGAAADIELRATAGDWSVEAGQASVSCEAHEAAGIAHLIARACAAAGERPGRRPELGPAMFEAAGLRPGRVAAPRNAVSPPVGPLAGHAFGVGLPPGRLDAGLLAMLADLAGRYGDGRLRTTPWRSIVLAGLSSEGAVLVQTALAGQIVDPADPLLRIAACIGSDGCGRGSVRAPQDAALLAGALTAGAMLHVSGCAKGCAHPGPAPLTLVGRDGRYDLVPNGCASDTPVRTGLTVEAAAALLRGDAGSGRTKEQAA